MTTGGAGLLIAILSLFVSAFASWVAWRSYKYAKRSATAAERIATATSHSTKLQRSELAAKSLPLLAYRRAKNVEGGREVGISNLGARVRGVEVKPLGGNFSVSLNTKEVLKAGDETGRVKFLWKSDGLPSEPLRFIFRFIDQHDSRRSQVYECDLAAGTLRLVGEADL